MELDALKHAWQTLGARLERQEAIHFQWLKERRLDRVRRQLRPLFAGQVLQSLLGIGLVLLGIACWSRNADARVLFWVGVSVHVFGVLNLVLAGTTLHRILRLDYAGPVLALQKQLQRLLASYLAGANLAGLSWWVMWMPVVLAIPGLARVDLSQQAPGFIWSGIAVSALGAAGTWCVLRRRRRHGRASTSGPEVPLHDGGDGIRRGQRLLDEIARFEHD